MNKKEKELIFVKEGEEPMKNTKLTHTDRFYLLMRLIKTGRMLSKARIIHSDNSTI